MPLITVYRQAGSGSRWTCNGMNFTFASSIRKPISFCASMYANNAACIASGAEDNPKKTPLTTLQLLARAARAGSHIGVFCEAIHRHQAELGVRRILGVLALARKYGVTAVDDACAAALELEIHEYRFLRRYLERQPRVTLRQVDPLIRELIQYRDLINLKTQENPNEHD